jgi:F-type H+-transporting ATPase subunit a
MMNTSVVLLADAMAHVLDENWLGPITKYQILAVAAAVIVAALMIPLAQRVATGEPVRGRLWNALEALLMFIRDEVARPNIQAGHHHEDHAHGDHAHAHDHHHGDHAHAHAKHDPHALADKFVPFLWTLFLFILTCNLLGMVPFLGSPTASISVTGALSLIVFFVIQVSAIARLGPFKYVKSFIPQLKADNFIMTAFLMLAVVPLIAVIEFLGIFIRAAVLAIRLFANMFGGHVALGVIMAFAVGVNGSLNIGGGIGAVALGTALSVLELFVAFLQAFVFVLLTSIFLGMQLNPEH